MLITAVTKPSQVLCDPMDCSTPGFLVHHQLLELAQTHVYQVSDAIQSSHPLLVVTVGVFLNSLELQLLSAGMCSIAQSYLSLCDLMDYSPPGSSIHGISHARILEWVAISSSRGSSWPRDQTCISCIAGKYFTSEPSGKPISRKGSLIPEVLLMLCMCLPRWLCWQKDLKSMLSDFGGGEGNFWPMQI